MVVMEELRVLVMEELPSGITAPIITIMMGKYGSQALTLNATDWSGQVSLPHQVVLQM